MALEVIVLVAERPAADGASKPADAADVHERDCVGDLE
jgi:hypothetical protein